MPTATSRTNCNRCGGTLTDAERAAQAAGWEIGAWRSVQRQLATSTTTIPAGPDQHARVRAAAAAPARTRTATPHQGFAEDAIGSLRRAVTAADHVIPAAPDPWARIRDARR
jgi:hypothetical protein